MIIGSVISIIGRPLRGGQSESTHSPEGQPNQQIAPETSTGQELDGVSVPSISSKLSEVTPVELAPKLENKDPYVRLVDNPNVAAPDLEDVFKQILLGATRVEHPSGISSLTLAFGSLISLCISHTDRTDIQYNKTTGRLDLSPLYGLTEDDAMKIRVSDGRGLLLSDTYFEDSNRLLFLPKATSILLILFSRNHNYIARRLLQENEKDTWVNPDTLKGEALAKQDSEIFELARRINCGLFRNIIANDFLKGLLGLGSQENSPDIDLSSNVQSEEQRGPLVSVEFSLLYNWHSMASELDVQHIEGILSEKFGGTAVEELKPDQLEKLLAIPDEREELKNRRPCAGLVCDDKNGCFDDTELANILQSATESIASAFKSRGTPPCMRLLELAAMKQARDWQVCSLNDFRKLLGLPAYNNFSEWCSSPEVASAAEQLYGDIDKLELYVGLRAEQPSGSGFCLGKTTTQGLIADIVRMIRSDPNFTVDHTRESLTSWGYDELTPTLNNGAFGASLSKLLLRHLPKNYPYNNVYGLFPFTIPSKSQEVLSSVHVPGVGYDFGKPVPLTVRTLKDLATIRKVFNDPTRFPTTYGEDLKQLTGGYGYMLGFDDKDAHDRDELITLNALVPDAGTLGRFAKYYASKTRRLINEKSKVGLGTKLEVDIIQDVINAMSAHWAAERLCGIPLNSPDGYTEKEFFQMLVDINNCIFGLVEPEDRLALRSRAVEASKIIIEHIEQNLAHTNRDPSGESFASRTTSLCKELFLDDRPKANASHGFLARLACSGHDTKALSANTLGLAVLSSVSYAQTCAAAVKFYLDEEREAERKVLLELAKGGLEVDEKIMGYIRESQRLNPQIPVLRRSVAEDYVLEVEGGSPIEFKKGDLVIADFEQAHAEPKNIDPDRHTRFLQGSGFHRCIGIHFVKKTMPEVTYHAHYRSGTKHDYDLDQVFKAIFSLEDFHVEDNKGGSLIISFKKLKDIPEGQKGKKSEAHPPTKPPIHLARRFAPVFLVITLLYWITIATGSSFSYLFTRACASPRHLRPWEVYTMLPGPDNRTTPFMYTLHHPRQRRLSFVDIDTRDMRFKIFVDGKLKDISTDFDLDKSIDCGQDANKCIDEGFSKGSVIVPAGKHAIKVEWIGKETIPGTNLIDWGYNRSRRFMWKQETC
ncbi:heme peroxidase [Leucogyrophana mollusca]|uniref:Heme peroxidase n=1 Tax=Leucogyrophana mollusca TaxID=85980 RepID=A0ACB8BSC1_9AGAM|nr:heme peroxidase [Leucogyrophana mollusca]